MRRKGYSTSRWRWGRRGERAADPDLVDRSGRNARTLLKNGPLRVTLVVLGSGGELAEHEAAAERAADVRRSLEVAGDPIGMAGYLIAGVCLARSASLLTRNRAHVERVPEFDLPDVGSV